MPMRPLLPLFLLEVESLRHIIRKVLDKNLLGRKLQGRIVPSRNVDRMNFYFLHSTSSDRMNLYFLHRT
jgi:hypothetical protein